MTAAELLAADIPDETAEEAYRRGYNDGMQVTIYYLSDGFEAAWLEKWRAAVVHRWANTETDQEIEPPQPDLWMWTDEGWKPLDEGAANVE